MVFSQLNSRVGNHPKARHYGARILLSIFLIFLSFFFSAEQARAGYYSDTGVAFSWIDATTGGTDTGIASDETSVNISIGFNFVFYSTTYTSLNISSNGFLSFGSTGTTLGTNASIPNASAPNAVIAPLWDDLDPSAGGAVYYLLQGTSPNRTLTIEWFNIPHVSTTGTATFEVTLYEDSNKIAIQYYDVNFGNATYNSGASATVGIEDANGNSGIQFSNNSASVSDLSTLTYGTIPTVDFSSNVYSGSENGGAITATVTLSQSSTQTVTVDYASSDGTAVAGTDYTAVSGTLTFSAGVTSRTFTVTPTNDTTDENDETVTLTLSNPVNTTLAGVNNPATLTITDDDTTPTVDFSSSAYSGVESGGAITVTVNLSNASALNVITVVYASSNGTAVAGTDYTAVTGTLTFNQGVTSRTFTVTPTSDTLDENDETVTLTLSNPLNTSLTGTNNPATLTITDDDAAPTVDFSSNAYSGAEDAGAITVTVNLSASSGKTITIDYASSDGTAVAGTDYTAVSGTLTFSPGVASLSFTLTPSVDSLDENDETVTLTLSNPVNTSLAGTNNPSTLTITDDDAAPTVDFSSSTYSGLEDSGAISVTVNLSAASGKTVRVNYASSNGTAVAGTDYTAVSGTLTFNPGVANLSFTVTPIADTTDENDETVTLALSNPVNATLAGTNNPSTLTITDDDATPTVDFSSSAYSGAEDAGAITVTVNLSNASALNTITVDYASSNGTATAGTDYTAVSGTLTFTTGITSNTFNLTSVVDTIDEDDETVTLTLSNPVNTTLTGVNSPVTLTIADDDPMPAVDFNSSGYTSGENGGAITITVSLSSASSKVITVDYASSDGTATAGTDYTAVTGTLTFNAGTTIRTFTVTPTDDTTDENDETVILTLSTPVNSTLAGTNNPATITITDNDPAPTLDFSSSAYSGAEDSGAITLTVSLSASSGKTVAVGYVSTNGTATSGTDYTAVVGTVTINPGVANGTFTLNPIADTTDENNETVILTLSNPVNATLLGANSPATLTIIDDDPIPSVDFSTLTYSGKEDAGPISVTVSLSNTSAINSITVDYATSDGTATAGTDYTANNGTITFKVNTQSMVFNVTPIADLVEENNETVTLTLSNPVSTSLTGTFNPATLIIINDDDTTPPNSPIVFGATPVNHTTPTWEWKTGGRQGNGTYRWNLGSDVFSTPTGQGAATSYTPGTGLAAGDHILYVQERDNAGNWSTSGSFTITIDTTLPSPPTLSGSSDTSNNARCSTFNWSSSGGTGTFRYKLDDPDLSTGATVTTELAVTICGLTIGEHTLYLQEQFNIEALAQPDVLTWSGAISFSITTPVPIPVLSMPGMIFLTLLMLLAGIFYIRACP